MYCERCDQPTDEPDQQHCNACRRLLLDDNAEIEIDTYEDDEGNGDLKSA